MDTTEGLTSNRLPQPSRRAKLFQTAMIFSVYFTLGLLRAQEAVVFLDLVQITNSDIATGSFLFTSGAVGFMVGVLVIGPLYDKLNNDILYCICISLAGVTTLIIPWCKSIYLMIAVFCLRSFAVGPCDTGTSVICAKIWMKNAGPFLQSLKFLFGMGGIIAPFVTQPFLITDDRNNLTTPSPSITYSWDEQANKLWNNTALSNAENESLNMSSLDAFPGAIKSNVAIAFAMIGGLLLILWLMFSVKMFVVSWAVFDGFSKYKEQNRQTLRSYPLALFHLKWKIACLAVYAILCFSYGCIEKILMGYLMTFTVEHLQWSKKDGSLATTLFWGGFAGGRFLGIILVKILKPTGLLAVNFLGLVVTFGTMALIEYLSWSRTLWWIVIGTSGLFVSSIIATLYSWLDENLTPITGKLLTYMTVWVFAGTMSHMSLLGYLFEDSSPMWFVYLLLIHSGTMLTSAVALYVLVRRLKHVYTYNSGTTATNDLSTTKMR